MSEMMEQEAPAAGWDEPKAEPKIADADLRAWRMARHDLCTHATAQKLLRADVARGAQIPASTLTQWLDGTYPAGSYAKTTDRVRRYLQTMADARQQALSLTVLNAPNYVDLPSSRELIDTLAYAQAAPELVVATMAAGMGKTTTCKEYASARSAVFIVTMRPTTAGVHAMLQELAQALEVTERNPARLDRSIGERLKRNGRHTLLIVDEAQNLVDKSVDQLRHFLDIYGCGIALVGNEEVYTRFGKPEPRAGYGQIHRRVGKRLQRATPLDGDITGLIDAWGIEDADCRRLLAAIGRKQGTLGQIDKTVRLAAMYASGAGKPMGAEHIRAAWKNRSGEAL